jgi:hypothetical protein
MGSSNLIPGSQVPKPPFDYHTPSFSTVAASTANVSISSAPATLDGVTLVSGERVLLKDQTDNTENGVYVFNGAASAMTRATDFDDNEEFLYGAKVYVREGTVNADTTFKLTSDNVTVDTDPIVWVEEEDHLVTVTQVTNALAYTVASTFKDDDILLVDDAWVGSTASVASSGTVASGSTRASLAELPSRASQASVGTTASVASSASLVSRASIASSGTIASHSSNASQASVSSTTTGASYGSVGATSSFAGAVTVTLNTSQTPVTIKRIGSGAAYVAVEAPGSTEIEGKDATLLEQYESIDVFTHNTNYFIR